MNLIKMQFPAILVFFVVHLTTFSKVYAVCPNGCNCDDDNLHVNCVDANLDIVPITLNPSVQRLMLKNNRIRNVDNGLRFYPFLNYIDLSHNHLILIQPGSFLSQTNLVELYLNGNKISHLSNKTFGGPRTPMNNLAILNLQSNLIDSLEPGTFRYVENLQELDLSQNAIKEFNISAFVGLSNLRILRLDNNELTQVPDVFSLRTPIPSFGSGFGSGHGHSGGNKYKNGMVPHLAELSLANNRIEKVKNDAFSAAKSLVNLDLRGCQISTIEQHAFRGLSVLRKLVLVDNNLATIPTPSFPPLIQLETLKLGRNHFDRIPKFAFSGLKKLKHLEISGSPELSFIETEAFSPNLDLETVELSTCKNLATLPPKLFKGFSGLKNLIIKDNALQTLPEDLVSWTSLRSLRLEGNPLRCSCDLFWLKDVLLQPRIQNTSTFVVCAEPKEVREKRFVDISTSDVNCYLHGPVKKTILGVSIFLAVIILILVFFLLYKYHDKIKYNCKRGFRRTPRRKRSSVVFPPAKELDSAKTFLQSTHPFSDEEFQVRTSLMSPTSSYLHPVQMNSLNYPYGSNNSQHPSLSFPLTHHNGNPYSSPSYNEYETPNNPVNFPQYPQHPPQIDLANQYQPTLPGGDGAKPIPITEL